MSRSEYAALIRDTIAYLKELPSTLLVSREEWQSPVHRQVKTITPTSFDKQTIASPKMEKKERLVPQASPISQPRLKAEPPEQTHIKPALQKLGVRLSDEIPDDAAATRAMLAYKECVGTVDVILFASDTDPHTLEFVKNLSRSIDQKLCPIKVLRPDRWEKEDSWDLFFSKNHVKLFLATAGFVQLKKGMVHYKRAGDGTFLHHTPLILLSPSETYGPKEKILLWNQLCAVLKT